MVDVMFTTAKDVERVIEAVDSEQQQAKRDEIIRAVSSREGVPLIKKSRALYWSPDHGKRAAFTISKHYARRGGPHYWYAYLSG
jgi:hypothetical protein